MMTCSDHTQAACIEEAVPEGYSLMSRQISESYAILGAWYERLIPQSLKGPIAVNAEMTLAQCAALCDLDDLCMHLLFNPDTATCIPFHFRRSQWSTPYDTHTDSHVIGLERNAHVVVPDDWLIQGHRECMLTYMPDPDEEYHEDFFHDAANGPPPSPEGLQEACRQLCHDRRHDADLPCRTWVAIVSNISRCRLYASNVFGTGGVFGHYQLSGGMGCANFVQPWGFIGAVDE